MAYPYFSEIFDFVTAREPQMQLEKMTESINNDIFNRKLHYTIFE